MNPRNADPFIDGPRLNPAAAGDMLKVNRAAVQSSSFTGRVVEVLEAGANTAKTITTCRRKRQLSGVATGFNLAAASRLECGEKQDAEDGAEARSSGYT